MPPMMLIDSCLVQTSLSRCRVWNMADALISARVKEAYIRPIRSVLVVDDDFHQYGAEKEGKDPKRARSLWSACRKEGFLCDVDDGAEIVNGKEPAHLTNSDLVILDYH